MSHILVTTLGKPRKDQGGRYTKSDYSFGSGFSSTSNTFLISLYNYLKEQGHAPAQVVILGTCSSAWDAILEEWAWDALDESGEQLPELIEQEAVTQGHLDTLSAVLTQHLKVAVSCRLIPKGMDTQEQYETLKVIADAVPDHSKVTMDVTHGFRHLPMMQLMAIFFLIQTKHIQLDNIYYAAFEAKDPKTQQVPAIRLEFIQQIWKWLRALELAEHADRLEKVADLMDDAALSHTLAEASFLRRTNQTQLAIQKANEACQLLDACQSLDPAAALYKPALMNLLSGTDNLAQRQLDEADKALRKGDYLKCAIMLREARISLNLPPERAGDYKAREDKNNQLNVSKEKEDEDICDIRNAMAHGMPSHKIHIQKLMQDEAALKQRLAEVLDYLKQDLPNS